MSETLTDRGFQVLYAADDLDAWAMATRQAPQVIVIDALAFHDDGLGLCRGFLSAGGPPIILLTSTQMEADRVVGLEAGADDCLFWRTSPRELLARVRALMRRSELRRAEASPECGVGYAFAGWWLNAATQQLVGPNGASIFLSGRLGRLLQALLERPHQLVTREELCVETSIRTARSTPRLVDRQVARLRARMLALGPVNDLIRSIRGRGYLLSADVRLSRRMAWPLPRTSSPRASRSGERF